MRKTIFAGTLKPHEKIALRGKANKGIIVELGKEKHEPKEEKKPKSFWEKIRSWFRHD